MNDISTPTEKIAAARARWKRNRDVISGEEDVKKAKEEYLPKIGTMHDSDYAGYLKRVPFYPAASRTHEGLKGLVFRKAATLTAPAALEPILETITVDGDPVDDVADALFSETLQTAFTGILVCHPPESEGLNAANAIEMGFRPCLGLYPAESFLEVTPGVVGNKRKLVRVRVHDDIKTIRELLLLNGIYTIIMHRRDEKGNWVAEAPIVPIKDHKPLSEIPFILCTPGRGYDPVKAPLDDVCALNVHHYTSSADLRQSNFFSANPIPVISGVEDAQMELDITPGGFLVFKHPETKVFYLEHKGTGSTSLADAVKTLEDQMAAVGSRILASEKAAAEAAETLAIRRASESSTLAALARIVSRDIEAALNWVAWWMGTEPVTFALNTDFLPAQMTSQEITARVQLWQQRGISHDTLIDTLKAGEVLPDNVDAQEERERIQAEDMTADRPSPSPEVDPTV